MVRRPVVAPIVILLAALLGACGDDNGTSKASAPAEDDTAKKSYLFVQNVRGGTFSPIPGREGTFEVALTGVDPHALFFTDRPARQTGVIPIPTMLNALYRAGQQAPNAAVEIVGGPSSADVFALTLDKPRYDAGAGTLAYEGRTLQQAGGNLAHYDDLLDRELPSRFDAAALFIDSVLGEQCESHVTNSTFDTMTISAASKRSTDEWVKEPKVGATVGPQTTADFRSDGGAFRGCENSYDLTVNGVTVKVSMTAPYSVSSEGKKWSCTSSDATKYACQGPGPNSYFGAYGPVVELYWTISVP